jgi:hypothetical protein
MGSRFSLFSSGYTPRPDRYESDKENFEGDSEGMIKWMIAGGVTVVLVVAAWMYSKQMKPAAVAPPVL